MAPDHLHLIRHAQGYHNLRVENHAYHDPLLTHKGQEQCAALASLMASDPNTSSISCIVASPMRRTLYTALNVFQATLASNPNMKIIALAELQETSTLPCDTGSSLQELRKEFADQPIDFSLVPENWCEKSTGLFAAQVNALQLRAKKARLWLRGREEKEVAVVTHGAFLHFLTGDWVGSRDGTGTGWCNCDLRTYTFSQAPGTPTSHAHIIETKDSFTRRKHMQRPLTQDEQLEIALVTQRAWAADGYIVVPDSLIEHTGMTPAEEKGPRAPVIAKIETGLRKEPKEGSRVDVSAREEDKGAGWKTGCNV